MGTRSAPMDEVARENVIPAQAGIQAGPTNELSDFAKVVE
jgi:hypothetical protein